MFAVARFLLEISQRTYPVASRMMKLSGSPRRSAAADAAYEFTGKLTTYGAFAEVFSQVLGRPITYVGITPEQAEQGMKSRGMPDWLVAHLVTIAKIGVAGGFSTENTKLIEDLVGRAPITTKQFVEDFKALSS